ncbi:MAG TPA: MMPL family transporter [Steroidobacteraceae bacterium]|jgi:predicted RND superfamily exporter protein|nr:MMPL family transporter [Steroidobacteraceae bacterium]
MATHSIGNPDSKATRALEELIFGHRVLIVVAFAVLTVILATVAVRGLRIDASFTKQLPLKHEYMQTFLKHQQEFGGANRVLIALIARDGNMFQAGFFDALKKATDEVLVMDGIDRTRVQSLFTPNVRYMEVVEGGIEAGNVVDAEFVPTREALDQVRENILKAGIRGRLVANDFSGALISAVVLERDATGKPIDPIAVAHALETRVRDKIQGNEVLVQAQGAGIDVHMIGFAKVMGDIADGATSVAVFAVVTILLTLLAVWFYVQSFKVAVVPIVCSIVAVVWQLGTLVLLGFGIDPLGLLVPFLIFAIGVSHGVQKISAVKEAALAGSSSMEAARRTFRQLLMPAVIALLADLVGFITILLIPVRVVQEMAITASIGVAIVILTDLVLLPVLVSWVKWDERYKARVERRQAQLAAYWRRLARITERGPALVIIVCAVLLAVFGVWKGRETPIGDTQSGVPELRADSRYNRDSNIITSKFSIGVDILNVIVETKEPLCTSYQLMQAVDNFSWKMRNVDGVQEVMSLPIVAKIAIAGWNEGSLKWRNIPREPNQLAQSTRYIETSTGLLNADCNVVPVMIFLRDHKAETIERVVAAVKAWRTLNTYGNATFNLATGNVGVMAATNEEVEAKEYPILGWVFAAVILMCLLTFRSLLGAVLVFLPLALVSVLVYAVMAIVGIGLKVSTLPMVALGAGIGVDYGIYLWSRMQEFLRAGDSVHDAYIKTMRVTGASIIFTGITLAIGVVTWVFSPLQFQADIGIMLTFMFFVNMLGAIILLPALAAWMVSGKGNGDIPRFPAKGDTPAATDGR